MAISIGSAMRGEDIECLLLWLLHQPGENTRVCSPYGSSRLLPASCSPLAYHGFSKLCAQWDTARQLASWTGSVISSPPGSSAHGIPQAKILEWVAILSSRASSWPRDWTHISYVYCIGGRFLFLSHQGSTDRYIDRPIDGWGQS